MSRAATYSAEEKLEALEAMIEDVRWARSHVGLPENKHLAVLRSMAAEIRGAQPKEIGKVLQAMTFQVSVANRAKARNGGTLEIGHMQVLSEGLAGKWWPTIKVALEKFEQGEGQ